MKGKICIKICYDHTFQLCIYYVIMSMFLFFLEHNQWMSWDKNLHCFHTLISLPGSVAIPSFQSMAFMMSNSAPWDRPSLGGVSVISTPLIAVHCKQ